MDIPGLEGFGVGEAPVAATAETSPQKPKKVVIVIDQEENQPNYALVGVQGKLDKIMRGVEVAVDPSVVHVLDNAVTEFPITDADGVITGYQPRHAIPYRVIRYIY